MPLPAPRAPPRLPPDADRPYRCYPFHRPSDRTSRPECLRRRAARSCRPSRSPDRQDAGRKREDRPFPPRSLSDVSLLCLRTLHHMTNSHPNPADVTRLLHEWRSGHKDALDRLMPLVYEELHFMASRHRSRERSGGPLQTTALVNEAYLKLVGQRNVAWQNRAHFFAIAAPLMRRIVVD